MPSLEGLIWGWGSSPKYVVVEKNGRKVVSLPEISPTFELGNVVDSCFFPSEDFSGEEIDILLYFEESAQKNKKGHFRRHSGKPSYSHERDVAETGFRWSKESGIKMDFTTLLTTLGHDRIEDDSRYVGALSDWRIAAYEGDHQQRRKVEHRLVNLRESIREEIRKDLLEYLEEKRMPQQSKEQIARGVNDAVDNMFSLTRFSNELPYVLSMKYQYKRNENEPIIQVLRRIFVKNCDRYINETEVDITRREGYRQLKGAFSDKGEIGSLLREKYGDLKEGHGAMPRSIRLQTAFNTIFPLQYSAEFLNEYGPGIENGDFGDSARNFLKAVLLSRNKLIKRTVRLLLSAKKMYEKDKKVITSDYIRETDSRIVRMRMGEYYNRVTFPGVIPQLIVYDMGGNKYIQFKDQNPDDVRFNYSAIKDILELIPRFGKFHLRGKENRVLSQLVSEDRRSPQPSYSPSHHQLFTLSGMDSFASHLPDIWEQYSNLARSMQKKGKRGAVFPLMNI